MRYGRPLFPTFLVAPFSHFWGIEYDALPRQARDNGKETPRKDPGGVRFARTQCCEARTLRSRYGNASFCAAILRSKRPFYQDRLGTNIGKAALKKREGRRVFLQCTRAVAELVGPAPATDRHLAWGFHRQGAMAELTGAAEQHQVSRFDVHA
eukprot:COSAG06_NODE_4623_length_4091_cov_16.384018_5_plen_153_part_00